MSLGKNTKLAIAGLALAAAPVLAQASWTLEPSLTYSLYEYSPEAGGSYDGGLGLLNLEFEMEDGMGNFHRAWISHSVYDDVSDMDVTLTQAVYRIGKYYYPKAEPTDFSIWTGIGYWELERKWDDALYHVEVEGGVMVTETQREDKYLYLPIGLEYATPIDNRGSWPEGFGAQRNHHHFFVMGLEANLLLVSRGYGKGVPLGDEEVSGRDSIGYSWRQSSGYGYRLWLGYDYRWSDDRVLTTSVEYQAWDVSDVADTSLWTFNLGLRFM